MKYKVSDLFNGNVFRVIEHLEKSAELSIQKIDSASMIAKRIGNTVLLDPIPRGSSNKINNFYLAEVTSYVLISANYYRYTGEPHTVAINPASTNSANVTLTYTEDVIGTGDSVVLFNTIEANNTGAGIEGNSMDENWLFDFFVDSGYYIEGTDGISIDQPINLTIQDGLVPIRGVPIVQYIPIGTIPRSGGGADVIVGITSYENHAQMTASTQVIGS